MTRPPCTFAVLLLLLSILPSRGQSSDDLKARLKAASELAVITDPALKPWHMRYGFDLLDAKGAVIEHGSVEEWWAATDRYKRIISSPSYNLVETRNAGFLYRTAAATPVPELEQLLFTEVEAPLPAENEMKASVATTEKRTIYKAHMDCIMLSPPSNNPFHPQFGVYPTYCFDSGKADLRISLRYGVQYVIRNRVAHFQGKDVPLELEVQDNGHPALKATLEKLTTYTPQPNDFESTPNQQKSIFSVTLGQSVLAGMVLKKIAPIYPLPARQSHISGVVVLRVTIGKDGHVTNLTPVRSPDRLLTGAAMDAVKQWVYQPYMLDGAPTEVEATITINFNIG